MEILSREVLYLPDGRIRIIYVLKDSWGRILHDTVEIRRDHAES